VLKREFFKGSYLVSPVTGEIRSNISPLVEHFRTGMEMGLEDADDDVLSAVVGTSLF